MTDRRQRTDRPNKHHASPETQGQARLPSLAAEKAQATESRGVLNASDALQAKGQLQRSGDPHALASEGVKGGGGNLPHMDQIQQSFGPEHDLSGVRAHVGGAARDACHSMGASAYASGGQVAFKAAPSLHLAAHEAAHVVQQRAGVSLSGGVGRSGDRYESQADRVADRVAAGQPASDLLPSADGGSSSGAAVQCYKDRNENGNEFRLSDDGKMAVYQADITGSQYAYGEPGLVAASSSALEGAQSVIRLAADGDAWTFEHEWYLCSQNADGELVQDVVLNDESKLVAFVKENPDLTHWVAESVEAPWEKASASAKFGQNVPDGVVNQITATNVKSQEGDPSSGYTEKETSGEDMTMWPDCGRAAKTVSGGDGGSGKGRAAMQARYKDADGAEAFATQSNGAIQKTEILLTHFGAKLKELGVFAQMQVQFQLYEQKRREWAKHPGGPKGSKGEKAKKAILRASNTAAKTLHQLSRTIYDTLSKEEQDAFDKKAAINKYADPAIGEAFHISTGGSEHPGLNPEGTAAEDRRGTWNFHWAGVIMKTGADIATLEGYADGTQVQNSDWVFQMYGVGSKEPGKSFHEQHRDVHKQHGTAPTTMAMRPKAKIKSKGP